MKRILAFTVIVMALTACRAPQAQAPDTAATGMPPSPTPAIAAEATTQASGGKGTEEPGSSMPPGATDEIAGWWGVIKSNPPGAQFDDCFERQDLGQVIRFGIDAMDPAVKAQIEALCDSGKIVHLYGRLLSNVPDCNGSQIQVDRIEV